MKALRKHYKAVEEYKGLAISWRFYKPIYIIFKRNISFPCNFPYFDLHKSLRNIKARLQWRFLRRFRGDFTAISNRSCKLLAIPQQFESPVVYTGDLKSRLKSQQKSPV